MHFPGLLSEDLFARHAATSRRLDIPEGASDAAVAAEAARNCSERGVPLFIVCADPSDVIRLSLEIPWLDPSLSVRSLPDWETLPYDILSPHEDLISERLETLYRLSSLQSHRPDVVLLSATTAAMRLPPVSYVSATTFFFRTGEKLPSEEFRHRLVLAGYSPVSQVMAPGEFCVRGEIIDLYPMGSRCPFRIGLFDDEIESIRTFDESTQRTTGEVSEVRVLPGHEFPMDDAGLKRFRASFLAAFPGADARSPILKDIASHVVPAGAEYYLPLFFEKTDAVFAYAPEGAKWFMLGDVHAALSRFMHETAERHRFLSHDTDRPALPPERLFLQPDEFFRMAGAFDRWSVSPTPPSPFPEIAVNRRARDPLAALRRYLESDPGRKLIVTASPGREETVRELLREHRLKAQPAEDFSAFLRSGEPLMITNGPLYRGFRVAGLSVITETELYRANPLRETRRREHRSSVDAMIRDLSELRVGDPVVHVEHGIGRYRGLVTLESPEGSSECLQIDYAADAKLYIPVSQLHLISRYSGADREHAPLHHLGRGEWEKVKKKASAQVRDTAAELLQLYAVRSQRKGTAFSIPEAEYEAFAEGFAFNETADQKAAIEAVLDDMKRGRPMDRLICGDVGFGKTEVALRAAFVAVMSGRQVAVLCPTTLLAEQHAQTFRDRFSGWPVNIAELSRFRSQRESAASLEGIRQGSVDIVIGTHKLLSESVKFPRLGLVVIDEEHRFGVRQKERLKALRAEVDVLTLTATPIPRTMSMSLEGVRDLSVIATAPERRLAVKTFVRPESGTLIRDAVMRELKRGGQVYFLHNDVDTIAARRERLSELLPEARIAVAHGQMPERELEHVMRDFYQQRFNVLLCTTIIETGIDVPTANTILIHRADKFGLAQLHQLRGRVGRSHHQAYAYLMIPPDGGTITKNAEKRLDALQNLEELGAGFYLAMHDLEIRGAGEMLGERQSGEIANVGFDLYNQMLRGAVRAMQRGETPDIEHPFASVSEINLHAPALLPQDYVPDVNQRLSFYKELAAASDAESLEAALEGVIDRYGQPPEAARTLFAVHRLRIRCEALGISKIDASPAQILITVSDKPLFDPLSLVRLMQSRSDMRMAGPTRVRVSSSASDVQGRIDAVRSLLEKLRPERPEKAHP